MFLKDNATGDVVEVLDIPALVDPCADSIKGRTHAGEALPRCWTDPHYRD